MKNLLQATKETLKNFYREQFRECRQAPTKNPYLKVELQTLCRQLAGLRKKRRKTIALLVAKRKDIAQIYMHQPRYDAEYLEQQATNLYYSLLCYEGLIGELKIEIYTLAQGQRTEGQKDEQRTF